MTLAMIMVSFYCVAQTFTLKGKVSDSEGNALELATVSCLSQGKVTMTNLKGEFSMKLHTEDSVVVKFSMVGYKARTRTLRKPRTTQTLNITMMPIDDLSEVVVEQKRRQTSQTEQIDIKDMKTAPSAT